MKRLVSTLVLSLTIAGPAFAQDNLVLTDQTCDNPLVGMIGIAKSVCRIASADIANEATENELAGLVIGELSQNYRQEISPTDIPVEKRRGSDQPQACREHPFSMACEIALIDQRVANDLLARNGEYR